ncbi:hypothetical protein CLOM_g22266 [Closterium sp. NIES-68]|nr:hypothetical protein CLOM_g22266 [Closterium sp. NIES-68]
MTEGFHFLSTECHFFSVSFPNIGWRGRSSTHISIEIQVFANSSTRQSFSTFRFESSETEALLLALESHTIDNSVGLVAAAAAAAAGRFAAAGAGGGGGAAGARVVLPLVPVVDVGMEERWGKNRALTCLA